MAKEANSAGTGSGSAEASSGGASKASASKAAVRGDLTGLGYEQAREELIATVQQLEAGNLSLEDSLALWERGEALAAHCQAKLDGARARLDAAVAAREEG